LECVGVADPTAGIEVVHPRGERDKAVKEEFKEDKRNFFALPRAVTDHSRDFHPLPQLEGWTVRCSPL